MSTAVVRTPDGYLTIDTDGGGGSPQIVATFPDNVTVDLPIAALGSFSLAYVQLGLYQPTTGDETSYRLTLSASAAGLGFDPVQVDSDAPLTTVDVSAALVAGFAQVRLTGSGVGTSTRAIYRIELLTK